GTRKVANPRDCRRQTDQDQRAGDAPVHQVGLGKGERQRQQAIGDEADQKSGEKEEGGSRDDARRFGVGRLLPSRVHFHVCSRRCCPAAQKRQLRCHSRRLTTSVSTEIGTGKGNGGDGAGTTEERGGPKGGGGPRR